MVGGVKEFELRCTQVNREFLPGYPMTVWGYNGSMPGPLVEAFRATACGLSSATTCGADHRPLARAGTAHPVRRRAGVNQDPIMPGKTFVYEYDLHQTGTYFYHSHMAMQEAFGMVGGFVIHPKVAHEPTVDRDFLLIFQNFHIGPNQTIPDSMAMDWNWHHD